VECVKVVYDPEMLSLERLVEIFFHSIDPLSLNRQGNDVGTRYRTGIYYVDEGDRAAIESKYREVESRVGAPIVVELEPLANFYSAEEYHQDYLDKNPSGYCHLPAFLFEYARKA
jgi:peptide methionine sulfoxide reductase msrA/msrB